MVDYTSDSEFKYVDNKDKVPMRGPDDFELEEKLEAVEIAETKLEADVHNGKEIKNPTILHGKAAAAYASYLLFFPGKSPEEARSGRLTESSGDEALEFAREFKHIYDSMVNSIANSEVDEGDSSSPGAVWETIDY